MRLKQTRIWRCHQTVYADAVDIYLAVEGEDGKRSVALPIAFDLREITKVEMIPEPTLRIDGAEARMLATALWEAGIRPHGIASAEGEIRRLENHLADMKEIFWWTARKREPD